MKRHKGQIADEDKDDLIEQDESASEEFSG